MDLSLWILNEAQNPRRGTVAKFTALEEAFRQKKVGLKKIAEIVDYGLTGKLRPFARPALSS